MLRVSLTQAAWVSIVCLLGCGGSTSAATSTPADASDDPTTEGSPPPDAGSDTQPMCYSDFPCRQGETIRCVDDAHYVPVATHDCHYTCGPGPCSGGTCDTAGPSQECPAGTTCIHGVVGIDFDHCGAPDAGADGAQDATEEPDGQESGAATCGDGFCRPAVMSSCGDPAFYAMPIWSCTVGSSEPGYCCLPKAGCITGYCTSTNDCHPPLMLTQVGCTLEGGLGSCCVEPK
ncbi:MAG: hypothetical protein HY898_30195 [Deltaproteobacteria bacterium]|nr:hypothetical protein [Deltaproteobacteria bacterium]